MIPRDSEEKLRGVLGLRRLRQGFVSPKACKEVEPPLKVLKVKADGRCMFRSITKGLAYLAGQNLTEQHERSSADSLRETAYQVICVKKRAWFEKMGFVEGDIKTYCQRMRFAEFFGGEPELYVLSEDVLKRPIAVYMEGPSGTYSKLLEYGSTHKSATKKPVRLLYNGVNHYDSLVPETGRL